MPKKPLKVGFQIDVTQEITITNSTLPMMEEAQQRGYEVYHITPENLSCLNGKVFARGHKAKVDIASPNFIELGEEIFVPMTFFDVFFVRQEPFLNTRFFVNTLLLEKAMDDCWIINNPISMRNAAEKINFFGLEEYTAPTLISLDKKEIAKFREEHGEIVIKPLGLYGGSGVFHVSKNDQNISSIVDSLFEMSKLPVVVQKYLPAIKTDGDKRVLMIFGKVVGACTRIPNPDEIVAISSHIEGVYKTVLNEKEQKLCDKLALNLHEKGIEIAGIDLIGGHLSEVNFITPGGFFHMRRLYDIYPEKIMWDKIEEKLCRN